jgi:vacuolar-type H+-ATPase subunit C/Vma6
MISYGGIYAKVRAMYGKRLGPKDFAFLASRKSVSEIVSFLKEHPGWSEALKSINPAFIHRAELEEVIRNGVTDECVRIYKFMGKEDNPLMRLIEEKRETEEILSFMRCYNAGAPQKYQCRLPEYFRKHFPIDFDKFPACVDFEQFLRLISSSAYYEPIARLPREAGKAPDYTLSQVAMYTHYFTRVFDVIERDYSGVAKNALLEGLGAEVDLMNIVSIIRIKQYFPEMNDTIISYLIPINHRLSPVFIRSLYSATSVSDIYRLLGESPYGKLFAGNDFKHAEDYSAMHLYSFNKRMLSSTAPSVYTPLAYIYLKENEVTNIVKIIECVRYGITLEEAGVFLAGLK